MSTRPAIPPGGEPATAAHMVYKLPKKPNAEHFYREWAETYSAKTLAKLAKEFAEDVAAGKVA